ECCEIRIVFDRGQPLGRDAAREQRLGDDAGAGTELEQGQIAARVDLRRHGATERAARGCYGAGVDRARDQAAEEAELVGEAGHAGASIRLFRRLTRTLSAWPRSLRLRDWCLRRFPSRRP